MPHTVYGISFGDSFTSEFYDIRVLKLSTSDLDRWHEFKMIFMFRIGKFYPNLTSDFDMAKCPEFWRSNKIKIKLLNMKDEGYMDNIQISAYVAIALDLLVGIGSFVIVWRYSKMRDVYEDSEDKCGPFELFRGFGRMKFILFKVILAFGMPLVDTIMGKDKLFL